METNKVNTYAGLLAENPMGVVRHVPGSLQYTNSANIVTSSLTGIAAVLDTNQSSFPNGQFTKVNSTDFRVDFTGRIEIHATVDGSTDQNDRAYGAMFRLAGADLPWTRFQGFGKNIPERSGSATICVQLEVVALQIIQCRIYSVEGAIVTIGVDKLRFLIKPIRIDS